VSDERGVQRNRGVEEVAVWRRDQLVPVTRSSTREVPLETRRRVFESWRGAVATGNGSNAALRGRGDWKQGQVVEPRCVAVAMVDKWCHKEEENRPREEGLGALP
jgi:hypothetical protein